MDSVSSVENLSETLAQGNSAGGYAINLSSNSLLGADNISFNSSILLGEGASGNDWKDVVIGSGSLAMAPDPTPKFGETAVGYNSTAGGYASAFGSNSNAEVGGVAIGHNTSAGQLGVALGTKSSSSANGATALGSESSASGLYSSTVGFRAAALKEGAVAIGVKSLSNDSYEATFGNLNGEELDVNITGNLTVHGAGGINLINSSAQISFKNSGIRIGESAEVDDPAGVAVGDGASTVDGVALGKNSLARSGGSPVALGNSASAKTVQGVAIGNGAKVKGGYGSIAIGYSSIADTSGKYSAPAIAIGPFANASAKNSIAIGSYAQTDDSGEAVFGSIENSYRVSLNITGNASIYGQQLDLRNGSIVNFFNQTQCQNDYVVAGVYPNGSYECISADAAVAGQDLAATLEQGNSAGSNSIDMNGNSINNIYSVSGTDGVISFNSDLNLGDNQLIVGNSSISGGLKIGSDINLQGNDLRQVGFINPSGASTNFGGDLNVGNDKITSVNNIEFTRGIEIGSEDTYTGQQNVAPASNLTVDTEQEWQNNGTIKSNLSIDGTNLELGVKGDKANWVWNSSTNGNGNAVDIQNGNLYVASGNEVAKYDATGGKVWSKSLSNTGNGIAVTGNEVFVVTQGNKLIKYTDQGGSATEGWNKSLPKNGKSVSVEGNKVYVTTDNPLLIKYIDNGNNASEVWNKSLNSGGGNGMDVAVKNQSVYTASSGYIEAFYANGTQKWNRSIGADSTTSVAVEGNFVYGSNDYSGLFKYKDQGSSATQVWKYTYPSVYITKITVENGEIYAVTGYNVFYGNVKNLLVKYIDKGSSVSKKFNKSLAGNGNDVTVSGDEIYTVSDANNLAKFKNVVTYHESGSYTGNVFDTGSVNPFPDFEVTSFLPSGTEVNVSVELSNSSDMSGSFVKKLELDGGTESSLLGISARYARFNVTMAGDSTDTPELDRVTINYGNSASAYGYNQIALGQSATTNAEGAVAIGYNASSTQPYTARFGNSQGQELDVEVTGNLSVDGSAAFGSNTNKGLDPGDINASKIYYNTLTAKSPVVQCSKGSQWCKVSVPENQSSFFVKKSENFDKDRPRETAEKVVESDVQTIRRFQELKRENRRQERKIQKLQETVQGLKSVVCEDNPGAEVCG
ncbi:MAG: PQQ-binding-like beta-propeller repeat protein [Candidatus Nanohalobium sp.]